MTTELNLDLWAIVKVKCSDGVERVGMIQQDTCDLTPERVLLRGLHEEYAIAVIPYFCDRDKLEKFDNDEDYEPIEF